jgi:dipeptidase E
LLGPLGRVNSPIVTSRSSKSRNSPCTNETNPFDIKKIYVGESAGSMILSPTIEYVKDMDDSTKALELKDSSALSIVKFYPLPHHTNFPFKKAVEKIIAKYESKLKLIPISNSQVILVHGSKIKIEYKLI